MSDRVVPLSEIKALPIPRAVTGFEELDFIYGSSRLSNEVIWGIPQSKISLWSGTSGIGKSRLAIDIAKRMSAPSFKVLYFQTEAELSDFAGWVKDSSQYTNIFCSGENRIKEIIEIMYEVKPQLIFIDSVNEIEEFTNGNKREARLLINGVDNCGGFRKACQDLKTHIILLGQLNQDMTIKGGTSLPHLVDIALDLTPMDSECKITFGVHVGIKHRCGRRKDGIQGFWQHDENGVHEVSEYRLQDDIWCKSHNLKVELGPYSQGSYDIAPIEEEVVKNSFFTFIGRYRKKILGKL